VSSVKEQPRSGRAGVACTVAMGAIFIGALAVFLQQAIGWDKFPSQIELDKSAWRAILINFLYFTPLAGGLVVWPAVVQASHGRWSGQLDRVALAAWTFAPVTLILLAVLWLGQAQWAPWGRDGQKLTQGVWLSPNFLFARDLWALAIFWATAIAYVRRRQVSRPGKLAVGLVIIYCLTFSLLGFDLVMALDPRWYSTLFGGYFFISGMYMAAAAWAVASIFSGLESGPTRRHDLGKLIVAFSLLTAYMMYSQLLPIWYENLPAETRFVIPRLQEGYWPYVGMGLLLTVYVGPLALLLTIRAKRTAATLTPVALLVLAAMWFERWYLVAPTPVPTLGTGRMILTPAEGLLAAALAAMLVLCMRAGLGTVKTLYEEAPAE
jgi:hypothetical protein